MGGLAGLLIIVGSCIWIRSAIKNRPFGGWFYTGAGFIAAGFFLQVVANG